MNRIALGLVLALALGANRAQAWGLPAAPTVPGGGGATAADLDKFLVSAKAADKLVGNAAIALVKAVGSKEANDKIDALLDAVSKMPAGAERDAKVQALVSTAVAEAQAINYKDEKNIEKAVNDADRKKQIIGSLKNIAIGSLLDVDLVAQGKKLISGVPSPDVATKIGNVKDSLSALGSQVTGLGSILSSTKSLLTKVGIDALPTKATDAPADVSDLIKG